MAELSADDLARGRALLAAEQAAHGTVKQAIAAYNLHKFAMEHLPALLSAASDLAALSKERDEARDQAEMWERTARDMGNNWEFYHGLVIRCGEVFGVEARTADDGSIQQDVLALKVPELVEAQAASLAALKGQIRQWAEIEIPLADTPDTDDFTHFSGYSQAQRDVLALLQQTEPPQEITK